MRPKRSAREERVFATTQWTRVLAAQGATPDARDALSDLCRSYYEPVVTFLRTTGRDPDTARDLTHAFFESILSRGGLDAADPVRGRFRSYLLGALKHFLSDRKEREQTQRRGGGSQSVPLASEHDTAAAVVLEDTKAPGPEAAYDRRWALIVLGQALDRLETEMGQEGRAAHFKALKPWLTGDLTGPSQAEAAGELQLNAGAFKVAVHRLRRRFRHAVKAEIARTLKDPETVGEELRHLMQALG